MPAYSVSDQGRNTMKRIYYAIAMLILVGYASLAIHNVVTADQKVRLDSVKLQSNTAELKQLQIDNDNLVEELDKAQKSGTQTEEQRKAAEQKLQQSDERIKQLEKEVSLKHEQQAVAQAKLGDAATLTTKAYAAGGTKEQWMAAAGIPQSDWPSVDYIVSRESGWDPCAYNPRKSDCNAKPSSACGLVQQYPCGKIAGSWTDPVVALKWQKQYVVDRYGGYAQAVAFWKANSHY